MKKSTLAAMVPGVAGGILFALGMCMVLLSEWGLFREGVACTCAGLLSGLIALAVWRRMEHKAPIRIRAKAVLAAAVGMVGTLAMGTGMCFSMVWGHMAIGIAIGIAGIVILLCLVPLLRGVRE